VSERTSGPGKLYGDKRDFCIMHSLTPSEMPSKLPPRI
jgi:hypothetical protein